MADTLYLAISYMDRFLSVQTVSRSRLQLVGVTCMLVAAKYEEIYAPLVTTHQVCWAEFVVIVRWW